MTAKEKIFKLGYNTVTQKRNKSRMDIKPHKLLREIRENRYKMSRPQFAQHFAEKPTTIENIELGKITTIPDDLALKLEKDTLIPFKYWKTGEGLPYFKNNSLEFVNRNVSENIKEWGKRLAHLTAIKDLYPEKMAKIMKISVAEYEMIIDKSPNPKQIWIDSLIDNIDVDLNWLLYGIEPEETILSKDEKKASQNASSVEDEEMKLTKEDILAIKALSKAMSNAGQLNPLQQFDSENL